MADNSSTDRGPANGIYLSDVLAMLRRRWYVVVVGLLLIAGGAGLTYLQTPKSYQATGQLLLLLPPQAGGSTPINPYLNLDSGLNTAAALVASTMNTPEMQRSVAAAGHLAQYTIALNPDTGPLLVITTEAAEPQQAIATRDEVITRLQSELERIQTEENAPVRQFIHTRTNATFDEAEVLTGDRTRAVAAVGAAGLLALFLVVAGWDRLAARRRARKSDPTRAERIPGTRAESSGTRAEPVEGRNAGRRRTATGWPLSRANRSGRGRTGVAAPKADAKPSSQDQPGCAATGTPEPKPGDAERVVAAAPEEARTETERIGAGQVGAGQVEAAKTGPTTEGTEIDGTIEETETDVTGRDGSEPNRTTAAGSATAGSTAAGNPAPVEPAGAGRRR